MNTNVAWGVFAVVVVAIGAWFLFGGSTASAPSEGEVGTGATGIMEAEGASVVMPGTYSVDTSASVVNWSGKKPLLDGYINSGTILLSEGEIVVGESNATGSFTIDMNTIDVGLTATKPGSEGALEGHLKGRGWFDVSTHPTAGFVIKKIEPMPDSQTTFMYTVTGDLTMKGKTNEIVFPAKIYSENGILYATAQTEIDRTRWGITAGSDNFFDNLGDNIVADEVALGFTLKASPL